MTMVTATPPAGIANAGTSDNRNVLLSVRDVRKVYGSREAVTRALDDVSFDICEGEFVGVMGPSGSGKSTLLNCISTIDTVTSGNIILSGLDITQLRSRQLSKFRRDDLGFIFQDANLLDTLTGFENIALALTIKGEKADAVRAKVDSTANMLGVTDVLQKYPRQMSGGQRQRVAAARAIVADPKLVLADEPTGAATALVSAQTSLAGIGNLVGFDQTVEAMYKVGRSLPFELRESALGGLAATPDACAWCESHMCGK